MKIFYDFNAKFPLYRQNGIENKGNYYFLISITFIFIMYIFETYLSYRQYLTYFLKDPPKKLMELAEEIQKESTTEEETNDSEEKNGSEEKIEKVNLVEKIPNDYKKSQAYGKDRAGFGFLVTMFNLVKTYLYLLYGFLPYIWDLSGIILNRFGYSSDYFIVRSLIIISIDYAVEMVLDLPFELFSTFVIEEKHGFNKQTIGLFIKDKIKMLCLMIILGYPLISLLLFIITKGGNNFVYYVWLVLFIVTIVMMTIYPVLIAPLFNKYTPLEEGPLRTGIEELANKISYPLTKIFVVDGSKRSSHSNAYLYGFYKNKRIVLFDTLIHQVKDNKEIEGIIGHEFGHWQYSHTLINFAIQQVYILVLFNVFAQFMNNTGLYSSFGFFDKPIVIGLILFSQCIWTPIDICLSFCMNYFIRRCEYSADYYSWSLGYGSYLKKGLLRIHLENLSNLSPDWLYSVWNYSHPTLVERINAIDSYLKKND